MGQIFVWEELSLLYRVATQTDLATLPISLPDRALTELLQCTIILDIEYGKDRDPMQSGGYSLVAEASADLEEVKKIIDYDTHPCEWATRLGNSGYLSALYLLNDDYSIVLFMPISIAPEAILKDLED